MQRPLSELRLRHMNPIMALGLQPWEPAPRSHPLWGVDDLHLHLTLQGYGPPGNWTTGPKGAQEGGVPAAALGPSCTSRGCHQAPPPFEAVGPARTLLDRGRPALPTPRAARGSHKAPGDKELCKLSTAAQRPSPNQRSGDVTGEEPANRTRLFSLQAMGKSCSSSLNLAFLSNGMKEKRPASFRGSV